MFFILRRPERDIKAIYIYIYIYIYISLHVQYHYSCQILMKSEFSADFRKTLSIKCEESPSSGSRVVPCGRAGGRTDKTKLIDVFHSFAKASKN